MLKRKITIKDLESVDDKFYNSIVWSEFNFNYFYLWINLVRDNNIDECDMELYFLDDYELLGEVKTHELKENGTEIKVTEENKTEYIELMVQWRFNRGVKEQTEAFFQGFTSVFPLEWLQVSSFSLYFEEKLIF